MNIGIFTWFGYLLPMEERARFIRAAGFDSVMLWMDDFGSAADPLTEQQPDLFRKHGLRITNVHLPFERANDLWNDNGDGKGWYEMLAGYIADCGRYNIPAAVVHPSFGDAPPPLNDIGLQRIRRLVELGEKAGVDVAFENLRRPEELEYIFGSIESNRLKFCYDSGHEFVVDRISRFTKDGYPHMDLLEKFGGRLSTIHLHDNDGTEDQHLMPFDGAIPWDNIIARLRGTGYDGDLTLESMANIAINNDTVQYTPEEFLAECMKRAKRLAAMMEDS